MSPSERKHKERRPLPNPKLPRKLGKLLVFGIPDENFLAFQLGKVNIYLERCIPIRTAEDERLIPKIAIIRYDNDAEIYTFLHFNDPIVERVFKHAVFKKKARTRAFFYSVANNILGLTKGKTIRIKSKHPKLLKELYDITVKVNKEGNFGVAFDYDEYDVQITLRKYTAEGKTWMIITSKGLDGIVSTGKST